MTSSLVGSEMCIRDRCHSAAAWCHARCAIAVPYGEQLMEWRVKQQLLCYGCLLYTSDAADDM
eukprot:9795168-Prorocentrum_lima.AAC.1